MIELTFKLSKFEPQIEKLSNLFDNITFFVCPFIYNICICLLKAVCLFLKNHGLTFTINLSKNLPTFREMVYCLCFLLGMRKFSHFDINYFLVLLFAESMRNEKQPAPSLVKTLPQIGKSFLSITFLFLFFQKTLNGGNKSGKQQTVFSNCIPFEM